MHAICSNIMSCQAGFCHVFCWLWSGHFATVTVEQQVVIHGSDRHMVRIEYRGTAIYYNHWFNQFSHVFFLDSNHQNYVATVTQWDTAQNTKWTPTLWLPITTINLFQKCIDALHCVNCRSVRQVQHQASPSTLAHPVQWPALDPWFPSSHRP